MKLFHLLLASLLLPLSLHAQKPCQELGDPHPADAASWRRVSAPCLGWGSIDQRYPKTAVPQLNPTIRLSAWKGERVNAQALLVTPKPLVVNLEFHLDLVCLVCKNFKIKHFLLFYHLETQ